MVPGSRLISDVRRAGARLAPDSLDWIQRLSRRANTEADATARRRSDACTIPQPLAAAASSVFNGKCLEQPSCRKWLGALGMQRHS